MIPVWSGPVVTIGDQKLQLDQTIDYKSGIDHRTSIGKVKEFMNAPAGGHLAEKDKESVWMKIVDAEDNSSEWISVKVWYSQFMAGIFSNSKPNQNDSKESEDPEDLPF